MPENEIIAEIHRHRAELARRCDFDLHKLMAFLREQEVVSQLAGRKLVPPPRSAAKSETAVVHEDPAE